MADPIQFDLRHLRDVSSKLIEITEKVQDGNKLIRR